MNVTEELSLRKVVETLDDIELHYLCNKGQLTLGLIKPHAYQGKKLPKDDDDAAQKILEEIGEDKIVFKMPTKLTKAQAETFYFPVRKKYEDVLSSTGVTMWDVNLEFMVSGPLTFLLIYGDGDTIEWWKNKKGNTHPKNAKPESIRGKYGIEEKFPNNLVHGSEAREEVRREMRVLRNIVLDLVNMLRR